jgi:hypothetical protein
MGLLGQMPRNSRGKGGNLAEVVGGPQQLWEVERWS